MSSWITVDPTESSTFHEISSGTFTITYSDKSQVSGDYFADNLELGGATVSSLTMGLAKVVTSSTTLGLHGLMGIGYISNEAIAQNPSDEYPNIVYDLVSQNIIGSYSYSLWLDDLGKLLKTCFTRLPRNIDVLQKLMTLVPEAKTGTILFGGYDSTKFQGSLVTMPTLPNANGVVTSFLVSMLSLSATYEGETTVFTDSTFDQPALLDSGTALAWVPSSLYAQLASYFGADANGLIDCGLGQKTGYASFGFGGITIQVPFSELAVRDSASETCYFGFYDGGNQLTLGDTFLRSAYIYYDLGNNEIGLAQTVFD